MWDMMVQCWNEIPSSRPTMAGNMSNMYEMIRNCRLGLPYDRSEPSFAQTQNVHDPQCSQVTRAVNATRPYDIGDDNLRTVFGTPVLSGQNSIQESHVIYYFENVWPVHSLLGATLNTTFELILKDPRGALTNAVCALANLHYTQLRVAQGLDAPDPNSEHSTAKYFYDEAYFQIVNAKQLRGSYTVGDAFTALHLICYSQLSGGSTDWITMLDVMFDWIAQSDLLNGDDPSVTLETMMSAFEQCGIKCVMMIDIMSSLTLMRPPKYFNLYQRLLGSNENSGAPLHFGGMQLELLSTCPGEAWLAIAEVSVLSSWKASEERKGSLSLREFIRRADDIERRLRFNTNKSTAFQADSPLAQNLHLGDVTRRLISEIFRETALLYLHTVMTSPPSVGGPEITSSVGRLVKMLRQLAPSSEIDRTLIFPMCLAGCMTDHPNHRAFLKGRLQALDNTIGNTSNVRLLMEGVWQRRGDQTVHHVDWREAMQDRSLNLLLI
ncbi:hypothetical protein L218DRAFT_620173 [Marasmius fiardii PR-910]|nr:hypothetical protein L218DRAFT_620173 [Marasmius fiardii PR-910]